MAYQRAGARVSDRVNAGRLGAKLFFAAGAVSLVNDFIPPFDHLDRLVMIGIGTSAIGWGVAAWWLIPWGRLHSRAPMLLALLALAHIAAGNLYGGVSEYSYAVYFVVVFVYIGMVQPPLTSVWMALPATLAYVAPAMLTPGAPPIAALSATTAIPVCVLVGEVIARAAASARTAKAESEHRAELLRTVAGEATRLTTLDAERVLSALVEAAIQLGYEAAELRVYDDIGKTHRSTHALGLPEAYTEREYPIEEGIVGALRREARTLVVPEYASSGLAVDELHDMGFGAVIASPIWSAGRLEAALVARARGAKQITEQDVEAVELLAVQAGRALDNARRYEEERSVAERLGRVEQLKGDFISNVSHELRTPLTVVEGIGITLADRWEQLGADARADLLDRLNRNAMALDDIISTLLDFSRLQSDGFEIRRQDLEIRASCVSVAARLKSLFTDHDLHVRAPEPAVVFADPVLLERVVENLLANAVRHTPAGTRVELSVRRVDDHVEVAVSDDGPGIAPEDLRHIGHRFYRGGDPNARPSGGTGLGLALSREVLRRHGTALEIDSALGEGSRFSFRLPVVVPEADVSSGIGRRRPSEERRAR